MSETNETTHNKPLQSFFGCRPVCLPVGEHGRQRRWQRADLPLRDHSQGVLQSQRQPAFHPDSVPDASRSELRGWAAQAYGRRGCPDDRPNGSLLINSTSTNWRSGMPAETVINSERERVEGVPLLLSAQTLAKRLEVSVRTLWRLKSACKLPPSLKIGGSIRWRSP